MNLKHLTPIPERLLTELTAEGKDIQRLILEQTDLGFRVIIYTLQSQEPVTVGLHRGGIRYFSRVDTILGFVTKNFPGFVGSGFWTLTASSSPPPSLPPRR